jgi:hypothetical protein
MLFSALCSRNTPAKGRRASASKSGQSLADSNKRLAIGLRVNQLTYKLLNLAARFASLSSTLKDMLEQARHDLRLLSDNTGLAKPLGKH